MSNELIVKLTDFQSIPEATYTFNTGITVIVGQSNSGKSATLRAIKAALLNPSGSQRYIKNGSEKTKVEIIYNKNNIEWSKGKKESSYKINEEVYNKLGTSDIRDYVNNSGFLIDEKGNLLNLEGELDLPFPFDKNSADLFKLFENIFCVSDSPKIFKAFKKRLDENNNALKDTKQEIIRTESKVKALRDLHEVVDISKLDSYKDTLESYLQTYSSKITTYNNLHKCLVTLKKFKIEPKQVKLSNDIIYSYTEKSKAFDKLLQYSKQLKLVVSAKEPTLSDIHVYTTKYSLYSKLLQYNKLLSVKINNEHLYTFKNLDTYRNIAKTYSNLVTLHKQGVMLSKKIKELQQHRNDLQEKLKQYKVCPLCGHEME